MTALKLLSHLRRCDVKLWVEDGQLCYDGPENALTSDLLQQVKERKSDLIDLLSDSEPSTQKLPLEPVPREGPHPLSFTQQRLWLIDQFLLLQVLLMNQLLNLKILSFENSV